MHTLVLEPEKVDDEYMVYSGRRDKRIKEYRDVLDALDGRILLKPDIAERAPAMADAVRNHWTYDHIKDAMREVALSWERGGLLLKGRADVVGDGYVLDLKTARCAHSGQFARASADLDYVMQMAAYRDGVARCFGWPADDVDVFIVAVETTGTPRIAAYRLMDDDLEKGLMHVDDAILAYRGMDALGWPQHYTADTWEDLPMPPWYK